MFLCCLHMICPIRVYRLLMTMVSVFCCWCRAGSCWWKWFWIRICSWSPWGSQYGMMTVWRGCSPSFWAKQQGVKAHSSGTFCFVAYAALGWLPHILEVLPALLSQGSGFSRLSSSGRFQGQSVMWRFWDVMVFSCMWCCVWETNAKSSAKSRSSSVEKGLHQLPDRH